ncbi:zinc ribbon domain-containing protein [uncultured Methanobrevibacter sp.]|uniref:zinc ribbon domain-containing protein n=1 Tax=uncultured Methanobrevibacter sp. TaxID=253161 RepID=UPI00262D6014|nr:zinc ribbon domain-containing protein [uncultured Methanobrevibacter sp.]
MKECDVCGTYNLKANNYCIYCGNRIAKDNICPFCGKLNLDNSDYCINCNKQIRPVSIDTFEKLFTDYNKLLLANAQISDEDYMDILLNIFKKLEFSRIVGYTPREKILNLASVFAECRPKAKGSEFGFEMGYVLYYDERLDDSIQIATIIHELTHFLLFDIIESLLCEIFQVKQSSTLDGFVWYFLSNDLSLMNEYCAHSVEGRFIPHGYQNYASFNALVESNQFDDNEILLAIIFGNTFANEIISQLEKYIDFKLREDIKLQFKKDLKEPDYSSVAYESDRCESINAKNNFILDCLFRCFTEASAMDKRDELIYLKEGIENRV